MASMDHTARLCHPVRKEPKPESTSPVDVPPPPWGKSRERQLNQESLRAGTALALAVIEGILTSHHRFKRVRHSGKRTGLLPLNPVQLIGPETAIDLLHHHVDTLTSERSG